MPHRLPAVGWPSFAHLTRRELDRVMEMRFILNAASGPASLWESQRRGHKTTAEALRVLKQTLKAVVYNYDMAGEINVSCYRFCQSFLTSLFQTVLLFNYK